MTFELKRLRCLNTRMGDSALFLTGFSLVHTHALHRMWLYFSPSLSRSLFTNLAVPYVCHGKPNFVCFYRLEFW